jgi:hypothetical protein
MNSITASVISGLTVRILAGMAGPLVGRLRRNKGRQLLTELDSKRHAKQYIVTALAEFEGSAISNQARDAAALFLQSNRGEHFARAVALAVVTGKFDEQIGNLRNQILALLTLDQNLSRIDSDKLAGPLVRLIATSIQRTAADLKEISPDDFERLAERATQEMAAGYLATLQDRTSAVPDLSPEDLVATLDFINKYCDLINARTSDIVPAYFDTQHRVPISEIYVEPTLGRAFSALDDSFRAGEYSYSQFVQSASRAVVLGDPGAGKSTLAQKITFDLSANYTGGHGDLVPFIVPLRSYERQSNRGCSIVDFLDSHIRENLQLTPPGRSIDYLLDSGRAAVIFDGLDELLDLHRRRDVTAAIESFSRLYPSSSIIVTSRRIGYLEAPLDPKVFRAWQLLEFSDDDVRKYADHWFDLDLQLTGEQGATLSHAFFEESASIPDLRRNPLMLSLLCTIYRGIRTIPQNRAELYEQCSTMMFERWDSQRGISAPEVLKAEARAALQHIALWIYTSNNDLADGVPLDALRQQLTIFWRRRYEDDLQARAAADKLISLWGGRPFVLSQVGTGGSGRSSVYKFAHRTFLEYFAAVELVRQNPSPLQLWTIVQPHLSENSWWIVVQVAVQVMDRFISDAGDSFLGLLIEAAEADGSNREPLLRFGAANLDSMLARPETVRTLTRATVKLGLSAMLAGGNIPDYREFREGKYINFTNFFPLAVLAQLNHGYGDLVSDEVEETLIEIVKRDESAAAKAFILGSCPDSFRQSFAVAGSRGFPEDRPLWEIDWSSAGLNLTGKIRRWSVDNFWGSIVAWRIGLIDIVEALEGVHYQPNAVICGASPFDWISAPYTSKQVTILEVMLPVYLSGEASPRILSALSTLGVRFLELSQVADPHGLRFDRDWLQKRFDLYSTIVENEAGRPIESLSYAAVTEDPDGRNAAFAAAVLLAVVIEFEGWNFADFIQDKIAVLKLGPLQPLEAVFLARRVPALLEFGRRALSTSGLTEVQAEILRSWAAEEENLAR